MDIPELVKRGLDPLLPTRESLSLLGAAVYSWWRPFPSMVYVTSEGGQLPAGFVTSVAYAITQVAGRSEDSGDHVNEHQRGEAYLGPEPYLFVGVHPSSPATSLGGRYIRSIVDAMTNSQSSAKVPDVSERIRLAVVTGDTELPAELEGSFHEVRLSTEVAHQRWAATDAGKSSRIELGAAIEAWIAKQRDSTFFQSLRESDSIPRPLEAIQIGQEILNGFLSDMGALPLAIPAHLRRSAVDSLHRRPRGRSNFSHEPGLVTMMRDVLRDAVATRRARFLPGGVDRVELGRVVGDRLYIIPSAARELVLRTGHTTATAAIFSRSLAAEGWIEQSSDSSWTVPRRLDGKLTRVWNLPTAFLGDMIGDQDDDDRVSDRDRAPKRIRRSEGVRSFVVDPALAKLVRDNLRAAIADRRASLSHTTVGIDLGRMVGGRLYVVPSAAREILTRAAATPASASAISRALEAAGWIAAASDGALTVPRRIDGRLARVWSLPSTFLE